MTREQLRSRYLTAIGRHWRSSIDRSGPTPALLDDLAEIAEDYAAALREARTRESPPVAASPSAQETPLVTEVPSEAPAPAAQSDRSPAARTRTRTRGGTREQT